MELSRRDFLRAGASGLAALAFGRGTFAQGAEEALRKQCEAPCNYRSNYTFVQPTGSGVGEAVIDEIWNEGVEECLIKYRGNCKTKKGVFGNKVYFKITMFEDGNLEVKYSTGTEESSLFSEDPQRIQIYYLLPRGYKVEKELHRITRESISGDKVEDLYGVPKNAPFSAALQRKNASIETGAGISPEDEKIVEGLTDKSDTFVPRRLETVVQSKLRLPFSDYNAHFVYPTEMCSAKGESTKPAHIGRQIALISHLSEEARNFPIGIWIPQLTFSNGASILGLKNTFFEITPLNEAAKIIRDIREKQLKYYLELQTPEGQKKMWEERRKKRGN